MIEKDDLNEQIQHEVARIRDLAMRSSDPLIVAKAIAVSDSNVQQIIFQRLADGNRLMEVIAYRGVERSEAHVFLRFTSANELIHIVDTGVLVLVDLPRGEIIGTIDPYSLQPEHRVARPFVVISKSDPWEFRASGPEYQRTQEHVRAFFHRRAIMLTVWDEGFGGGGGEGVAQIPGGVATVDDTIFGTETWSRGVSDDTKSDRTQDYNDR